MLELRATHPRWGGRKIARRLQALNQPVVPAPSTITAILRRHGAIDPAASAEHRPFARFEHAAPNQLWQMDFKGHFACGQGRCHPLTALDDHARFALGLVACGDQRGATVQARLVPISSATACPRASSSTMAAPGAAPGATGRTPLHAAHGVAVAPGRAGRPCPAVPPADARAIRDETEPSRTATSLRSSRENCSRSWDESSFIRTTIAFGDRVASDAALGKDERFHRALKAELLQGRTRAPIRKSLPALDYGPTDQVRKVQDGKAGTEPLRPSSGRQPIGPSHRNKGVSRPIEVLVQKWSRGLALVFSVLCLDRLGGVFQDVVDPQRSQGSFA